MDASFGETTDVNATTSLPMANGTAGIIIDRYLPPVTHYLCGFFLAIASALGIFENGSILLMFLKNKNLRSVTNLFIMSLSAADLALAIFGCPMAAISSFALEWVWGEAGCVIHGFMVYWTGLADMYCLMAIAIDRYVVIVKPLQAPAITKTKALIAIVAAWAAALVWSLCPLLGWSKYTYEGAGTLCGIDWITKDPAAISYATAIFICCYAIPVGAMIFCYVSIYMTVLSSTRSGNWDKQSSIAKRNARLERKMAIMTISMMGNFLICWTPYALVSFIATLGDPYSIPIILVHIPALIAKTAMLLNPIIYVGLNQQFRDAFLEMCPCCKGIVACFASKPDADDDEDEGGAGGSG